MPIPLVDEQDVKSKSRSGNGIKYGKYSDAISSQLEFLKEGIAKEGTIRLKIRDVARAMGKDFERKSDTAIYWGLKYALFKEDIVTDLGAHKDGITKLLVLRAKQEDDVLPESYMRKYNQEFI